MSYLYESLLDEHFQMLCRALLVKEYRGVQCLPVGMPDGGRDGTAPDASVPGGTIIFQVKFARSPANVANPVRWVTDAIDGELPKIERLAARGATGYVLITNMFGTSHLDVGRIDRVQNHLNAVLPTLSASCTWREDLDRRLDGQYDIKLRYPALLNGTDVLRGLWEKALVGEGDDRRQRAVKSYLAAECAKDATVRFKQAELLPSPLLELFIDVPAEPPRERKGSVARHRDLRHAWLQAAARSYSAAARGSTSNLRRLYSDGGGQFYITDPEDGFSPYQVGAAELLLDAEYTDVHPMIALEGAPGQGKSTLAQYLCQVHRIRLLGRQEVTGLPGPIAASAIATST